MFAHIAGYVCIYVPEQFFRGDKLLVFAESVLDIPKLDRFYLLGAYGMLIRRHPNCRNLVYFIQDALSFEGGMVGVIGYLGNDLCFSFLVGMLISLFS